VSSLGALIVGEVLTGLIETDPASFVREEPGWEPGELGRTIVGEVLLGLVETDPSSYLVEEPDWAPGVLGGEKGKFPMASFVRFARGEEPL